MKIGEGTKDYWFSKSSATEIVDFIQKWIEHTPEQDLIEKVIKIRATSINVPEVASGIIAAVREHDENQKRMP